MQSPHTLVFTDLVDSTAIQAGLDEAEAFNLWRMHDKRSRDLHSARRSARGAITPAVVNSTPCEL
jgi:hypothetical protein